MKQRTFLVATLFLTALGVGCADGPLDYDCTATWFDADDMEIGMADFSYKQIDDSQEAVDMCSEDQGTDPDRPLDSSKFECDCEST